MPALAANRITVINQALFRAGCLPLNEGVTVHPSGAAVTALFDLVLKKLLAYPWHFAKRITKLGREVAAPDIHWTYAFNLPGDRIGPPLAVYNNSEMKTAFWAFELLAHQLVCDEEEIWIRDSFVPAPGLWPGYFDDIFTLALAAEYASSIREDWGLRDRLLAECFGPKEYFGQSGRYQDAKTQDAIAEPGQPMSNGYDPLTTLMRSGG